MCPYTHIMHGRLQHYSVKVNFSSQSYIDNVFDETTLVFQSCCYFYIILSLLPCSFQSFYLCVCLSLTLSSFFSILIYTSIHSFDPLYRERRTHFCNISPERVIPLFLLFLFFLCYYLGSGCLDRAALNSGSIQIYFSSRRRRGIEGF